MEQDIAKILFNEEEITKKVTQLGRQITQDYRGKDLILVGILKGASVFMSDLMRKISIPINVDFMAVSSYGLSTESSGVVKIIKDLDYDIEERHVLIVEDIIDTGLTLNYIYKNLLSRNPKSLKVCTLLDKLDRRKVNIKADYKGFNIPDEFIIGYGIDYAERYRNLPYVAILKREIYEK